MPTNYFSVNILDICCINVSLILKLGYFHNYTVFQKSRRFLVITLWMLTEFQFFYRQSTKKTVWEAVIAIFTSP